ncbi:hypothetical protein V2J09_023649 [Rumex salicifolius]
MGYAGGEGGSGADTKEFVHGAVISDVQTKSSEGMEASVFPSGPYPEHEGEPDCAFYLRTGFCKFGSSCRFNHPSNRNLAITVGKMKGDYPERFGQPECQYYMKTGHCKFGATCKFHHPQDKSGIAGRVPLNTLGYPIRPNEQECAYFLRTGLCKFGSSCKFHHPHPTNLTSFRGPNNYPPAQSPTTSGHQSFQGGITNWPLSRAPVVSSPRWQPHSSYTPLILPQGVVSVPGWNTYSGQSASVPSSENQHQRGGNTPLYGASRQSDSAISASQGTYSGYQSGSVRAGYYALQKENAFPERPGQPECQYYMKTGDCKFGPVCKFHHPYERLLPAPNCPLSPMGLPLRSGEPLCTFYSRYGICKFGPNCKFDHTPLGFADNVSPSVSTDTSVVRHYYGSSSTPGDLNLAAEGLAEMASGNIMKLSLAETREISSVLFSASSFNCNQVELTHANGCSGNSTTADGYKLVPLIDQKKVEMMMVMNETRRKLGTFQLCAPCTCCGGSGGYCLPYPCCYAINCNIPNRPFGFCSFTPRTCNCFGCHA